MQFPTPLIPARLIRRYKRFLADVVLESDGCEVTAHCPNPGAMLGLAEPGARVWLEPNDDPRKKLKFGWRLVELPGGHFAGIDTAVPNRVIGEALRSKSLPEFADYGSIRPEVRYGAASRIDFLAQEAGLPDAYIEVKNAHLRRVSDVCEFPDCVTVRGAKHLHELSQMAKDGHRAVMLFLVQRTDCTSFQLARDLDPAYGIAFDKAKDCGVEVACYGTRITTEGVALGSAISMLE